MWARQAFGLRRVPRCGLAAGELTSAQSPSRPWKPYVVTDVRAGRRRTLVIKGTMGIAPWCTAVGTPRRRPAQHGPRWSLRSPTACRMRHSWIASRGDASVSRRRHVPRAELGGPRRPGHAAPVLVRPSGVVLRGDAGGSVPQVFEPLQAVLASVTAQGSHLCAASRGARSQRTVLHPVQSRSPPRRSMARYNSSLPTAVGEADMPARRGIRRVVGASSGVKPRCDVLSGFGDAPVGPGAAGDILGYAPGALARASAQRRAAAPQGTARQSYGQGPGRSACAPGASSSAARRLRLVWGSAPWHWALPPDRSQGGTSGPLNRGRATGAARLRVGTGPPCAGHAAGRTRGICRRPLRGRFRLRPRHPVGTAWHADLGHGEPAMVRHRLMASVDDLADELRSSGAP